MSLDRAAKSYTMYYGKCYHAIEKPVSKMGGTYEDTHTHTHTNTHTPTHPYTHTHNRGISKSKKEKGKKNEIVDEEILQVKIFVVWNRGFFVILSDSIKFYQISD